MLRDELSCPIICQMKTLIYLSMNRSMTGGHPFRPVKKLAAKLASYFMQMRFEVIDLKV